MFPVKLLIFAMIFCELAHASGVCPKGQRVTTGGCATCPPDNFQPEENRSKSCRVCTRCNNRSGSDVGKACTKVTNTICRCRGEFVARDTSDSSTCQCNPGFGLKDTECLKCEDGYFSTTRDVPCRKWRECKSAGIKVKGTTTSDVICNEEPDVVTRPVTTNSTPKEDVSLSLPVTPNSPHEGNQTHKMLTTTTATPSGNVIVQTTSMKSSNMSNFFGILITFTTVGLLVLIALTLKFFASPHVEKECEQPTKHESLCQPVMEIGDRSCSYIKLNPDVV
ncbi:tumor necrosis factor receptor superfamily member 4 [Nelusetta ayraudi]|uniref:tumor necrosis factor receptor superfamily member 4 n=1 Tax=Nelusetta ayraudi TaxID=303726 RepID=UPI003F6F096A